MLEMCYISIWVVVTWVHTYNKIHQTIPKARILCCIFYISIFKNVKITLGNKAKNKYVLITELYYPI